MSVSEDKVFAGKIGIAGNRLYPFNEAYANQMRVLSELLNAKVFTCNDIGWSPFKIMENYIIINNTFIIHNVPLFSTINRLFLYIALKIFEQRFDIIILSAGVESEFLNYLNLKKCIPIISTIDDEGKARKFASEIAPKLKKIVVQSRRIKDNLIGYGVDPNQIYFMYPIIDPKKFKHNDPPPLNNFRVLFASAPNVEDSNENNFEAKGVSLLLEAFKKFTSKYVEVKLRIIWRDKHTEDLYNKIEELGLEKNVEVINKNVKNMAEEYSKIHVTVIPFKTSWRSPEIPLSALESLASGRPVVTTDVIELAEIIRDYHCGSLSKPNSNDFLQALIDCRKNYLVYQKGCETAVDKLIKSHNLMEILA